MREMRADGCSVSDPFLITGPAVISFSGGRTSAYMLWRILQAHGGTLPDDVVVCFANTGREMPATLDFVRDCAGAWSVRICWVEYRRDATNGRVTAEEVNHNSASRNGEPFEALIAERQFLPNPVMRFCTTELKIRTIRLLDPARQRKYGLKAICPLAAFGVQEIDVLRFWRAQSFDLRLAGRWEGNCDGCFLKPRAAISRMCRDHPERMEWWRRIEQTPHQRASSPANGRFRHDREDYAAFLELTRNQGVLPWDLEDAIPCDEAGCGV
jgi:hypothetical protein